MAAFLKEQISAERREKLLEISEKIEDLDMDLETLEPDPDSDFFYVDGFKCCILTVPYFLSLPANQRSEVITADYVNLLDA